LSTQKLTFQPIKANFEYEVLRNYTKLDNSCYWYQQSKPKC